MTVPSKRKLEPSAAVPNTPNISTTDRIAM